MVLVHWAPFREIDTLQREMSQLFDSLVSESGAVVSDATPAAAPAATATPKAKATATAERVFVPAAEIYETPTAIHLNFELPGVNAAELDIQVTAESVTVTGDRQATVEPEAAQKRRTEFRYGAFRRVVPLPARIQNDKVQADYQNGILSLVLPKVEAEKNKVVKVSLG
ncbi:MAG TPA: Hsp20/alpha crystallin family protein [Chroococcidiopsis sp.]